MGAVFLARQISMDRNVALKVLPLRLARNERFVKRFLREARSAARLSHRNIVHGIDAGHAEGHYYFAMEYVDGPSLYTMLRDGGPLPERRALEITRDVARALYHAHSEANIIHRDVKPGNILIAADGTAKLTDLGLAREATIGDSTVTQTGATLGTPTYISPEQIRGQADLDGRTDVYSLGATLYFLLTAAPPYDGNTPVEVMAKHLTEPPPDPRALNDSLSSAASAIVRKAMTKERDDRYSTALVMADDIELALAGRSPTGAYVPAAEPVRPAARRRRQAPGWRRLVRSPWAYVGGLALPIVIVLLVAITLFARPESDNASSGTGGLAYQQTTEPAGAPPRPERPLPPEPPPEKPKPKPEPGPKSQRPDPTPEQARAAVRKATEKARAMAKTGDYDAALKLYADLDPMIKSRAFVEMNDAEGDLIGEAESKISRVLGEVLRLEQDGKFPAALKKLGEIEHMKFKQREVDIREVGQRLKAQIDRGT